MVFLSKKEEIPVQKLAHGDEVLVVLMKTYLGACVQEAKVANVAVASLKIAVQSISKNVSTETTMSVSLIGMNKDWISRALQI